MSGLDAAGTALRQDWCIRWCARVYQPSLVCLLGPAFQGIWSFSDIYD